MRQTVAIIQWWVQLVPPFRQLHFEEHTYVDMPQVEATKIFSVRFRGRFVCSSPLFSLTKPPFHSPSPFVSIPHV